MHAGVGRRIRGGLNKMTSTSYNKMTRTAHVAFMLTYEVPRQFILATADIQIGKELYCHCQ